jgi:DNA polymerase/3'-5' exonuclease PolX
MSEGKRIPRETALRYVEIITSLIRPYCERVEIAGSLRRETPGVGDIEIVCIPKVQQDLFGYQFRSSNPLEDALRRAGFEKYKKFFYVAGQVWIDLFITTPERWGVIFTIRTGSAVFSRRLVTPISQGGSLLYRYCVEDGRVVERATGKLLDTPEEIDFFRVTGIAWREPRDR